MEVMSEAADPGEVEYDEHTGRWRFKPRGLHITWSSNPDYWTMPEKGTDDPAELLKVVWLEIEGSTPEPLSKGERYALSFKISMAEDRFGWQEAPAFMMAKVGKKGIAKWARINLEDVQVDGVKEVPLGKLQFEVPENAQDTTLYFGFYELWSGGWKGGLRIHEGMSEEADPGEVEYDKDTGRWRFKPRGLTITWGSNEGYWKMPEKGWRFKPRGLHITWSSNPDYWTMPEKGTDDPAELLKVCWLEIKGSTPKPLSKGERYALSFKISMAEDTFGWQEAPAFMMAKVGKKGIAKWARINLADVHGDDEKEVPFGKLRFEVSKNAEDTTLHFGFYELWSGGWKGGLRIHEALKKCQIEVLFKLFTPVLSYSYGQMVAKVGHSDRGASTSYGATTNATGTCLRKGKRGRYKWNKIKLQEKNSDNRTVIVEPTFQIDVNGTTDDNKLYFGLYEVWTGKWKGGLLIHGATVDPVTS
ncbi:LOW QUALITY PROTEIN: hypothetical protein NC651_029134 [Populus alba x Populus x berolinensis]|nr:LOW QUALITY PROTEIN: hypothetical protein NC651_029134 [Populus alba x Populus x berolinensis]